MYNHHVCVCAYFYTIAKHQLLVYVEFISKRIYEGVAFHIFAVFVYTYIHIQIYACVLSGEGHKAGINIRKLYIWSTPFRARITLSTLCSIHTHRHTHTRVGGNAFMEPL